MFVSGISKISKLSASVYTAPFYVYRFSYRGNHSMTELLYTKENLGKTLLISTTQKFFYMVKLLHLSVVIETVISYFGFQPQGAITLN